MPNGHTTQLTFSRQEVFDVGDVLLVGTDFYCKVPHDVWPLKPRVGIVRRAINEGVVLETSDGLELLEGDYPNSIMPGTTGHNNWLPSERGAREVYSWAVE